MKGKTRLMALAVTAAMGVTAAPAAADTVFGVTDSNRLVAFDTAAPGTVSAPLAITGLGGDSVVGIDVRPATLQLYALGASGQLYKVDTVTGAATTVGAPLSVPALSGGPEFDIDFNPTIDRLRIVSQGGQSLAVNPNTGGPNATVNGALNPGTPRVTGVAYTNNHPASGTYPAAPTTVLFDIDSGADTLNTQNTATGALTPVGPLGIDVDDQVGFDIVTNTDLTQVAYAALRVGGVSKLYSLSLATGAAQDLGALPTTDKVKDIAVAAPVPQFVVLGSGTPQTLSVLRADRPGVLTGTIAVSGLQTGERLRGIDTRPSDGTLYGLGDSSRLYTIDARTGVATAVDAAAFAPAIAAAPYGFDFNPSNSSAAIRLLAGVANSTLSAASPVTHTGRTDLTYMPGDPNVMATPNVRHAAYTKLASGPRLFDIDTTANLTAEQTDFNGGLLKTVGQLGINVSDNGGLEAVDRFDQQFAALEVEASGKSTLYTVNGSGAAGMPANGSAAAIGDIGLPAGVLAEGLAQLTGTSGSVAPPPDGGTPTGTPTGTPVYTVPPPASTPPYVVPNDRQSAALKVSVKPKRDRKRPFRFRVRGTVTPKGAARGATVRIIVKRKGSAKVRRRTTTRVKAGGKFTKKVTFKKARKQLGRRKGKLVFRVKFLGNSSLKASKTAKRTVRYGRG